MTDGLDTVRAEARAPRKGAEAVAARGALRGPDDLDGLGVETSEVRHDSAGRNVLIGAIGLVLVIGALIPLTIGALWVGTLVYAGVAALLQVSPTSP